MRELIEKALDDADAHNPDLALALETLFAENLAGALKEVEERDDMVIESLRDQVQASRDTELAATHAYELLGDRYRVACGSLFRIAGPEFNLTLESGMPVMTMGAQDEAKAALKQCKWGGKVEDDQELRLAPTPEETTPDA